MKHLAGKSAILYRRVSTTEQKDTGSSLSSQNEQLIEYCNKNEIVILKDFEEDYSAKNFNRPEFNKLLEFAVKHKTKIDYLLINRWDRFSRDSREGLNMINTFKNLNIEINSTTQWINHSDPNQLMMLLINLGIPETDNRLRGERTIEGTRRNLKDGRWVHSQPKGYKKGKDELGKVLMKPDPKIASLITELFTDFSLGIYSQNEIRTQPKYKSLNLSKSGLSRILNQIVYSGRIRVKALKNETEQIVDALHKPLVSIDVFEKVQYALGNRKRIKHKPVKQNNILPLRGYLECKQCGGNLTGSGSKSKTGKKHYYYHCNQRKGCNERYKVGLAHEEIKNFLNEIKPKDEVCELFEHIMKDKFDNSESTNKSIIASKDKKIKELRERRKVLLDKCLDGVIENEIYKTKEDELSNEIKKLESEKSQLNTYEKDSMEFIKFGLHVIKNIGTFFEKSTINTKQKLISSIFKEKLVFNGEKYRTPILNKGLELISLSINMLEFSENKNGGLSFDNLPLCTRDGT
jgi:site-specific DNA recombinase